MEKANIISKYVQLGHSTVQAQMALALKIWGLKHSRYPPLLPLSLISLSHHFATIKRFYDLKYRSNNIKFQQVSSTQYSSYENAFFVVSNSNTVLSRSK